MAWSQKDVEGIRKLQGHMSALSVARMYKCSAETIRRLWRGETYPQYDTTTPVVKQELSRELETEADEFLAELMKQQGSGPERKE